MRGSNIFLIVITSIITFIGLFFSKIYDKYVKQNLVVQIALYLFWTILVLRLLYWVAKPVLSGLFPIHLHLGQYYLKTLEVLQGFNIGIIWPVIIFVVIMLLFLANIKSWLDKLSD